MELLLKKDIDNLGKVGDIVRVAPGYARNYLVPRGLATTVSPENLKALEAQRRRDDKEQAEQLTSVREAATKLSETSVTIAAKASEEGSLYGSVNADQIVEAINKEGFELESGMIELEAPIKQLDVHDIKVRLHPEVDATCRVWIVAE